MSEENNKIDETLETGSQQDPPAGDQGGDVAVHEATESAEEWKAKARYWEGKAKANKDKAAKYDELEEASKSELQKATERAQRAESELEHMRRESERNALVSRIASESNVPAALLVGDDEEQLRESAAALVEWNSSTRPSFPPDTGGGNGAPPLTKESIEQIEDPIKRVRARAENQHLYR